MLVESRTGPVRASQAAAAATPLAVCFAACASVCVCVCVCLCACVCVCATLFLRGFGLISLYSSQGNCLVYSSGSPTKRLLQITELDSGCRIHVPAFGFCSELLVLCFSMRHGASHRLIPASVFGHDFRSSALAVIPDGHPRCYRDHYLYGIYPVTPTVIQPS